LAAASRAKGRLRSHGAALRAGEFADLLASFAPFEPHPEIAVAVSGGADSMALATLAAAWAKAHGGRAVALTVDHGLRRESLREAQTVARWLAARNVPHRLLRWRGEKPKSGIQSAAREARYRLLRDWCRDHAVLHLLLAHTMDDQAETFLLRLERGSGADGLACMPAVAEGPAVRLLRPFLAVPKARLIATLEALGQPWIEDPSNQAERFARVRTRRLLSAAAACGFASRRVASTASAMARARAANEKTVAAWLVRVCSINPAGYIEADMATLRKAPRDIVRRVLLRCLICVSGSDYAPRGDRLERLLDKLLANGGFRGQTLGGCRIIPGGKGLLVCREWAKAETRAVPQSGGPLLWDGRFWIGLAPRRGRRQPWLGPLGETGWAEVVRAAPGLRQCPIPAPARPSLPALFDARGVVAVPHLGYRRNGAERVIFPALAWRPRNPLTSAGFSVA